MLVFVSNNTIDKDVWFDNVNIQHQRGYVVEENHYYPFGLTLASTAAGSTPQPYKSQSKQLEKSLSLELNDFGARMYDPQLGRWNVVDPLAEKYPSMSPYVAMANNPVMFVDPDGRAIVSSLTTSFTYFEPRYIGDLGVTDYRYRSVGISSGEGISFRYNASTNEYDMIVPIYINYSRAFGPDGTGPLEQQNPRLFEQTKAHEEGHKDQMIEAASLSISLIVSIGGEKQGFSGRADQVMTNIKASWDANTQEMLESRKIAGKISSSMQEEKYLKQQNKAFNRIMKTATREAINQVNGKMSDLEGSLNINNAEIDANHRAQNAIGPLPYNTQNEPQYNGKVLSN